jgi:hypothetical protein
MKLPSRSSQLRSHPRTADSASGVIGVKELIRNSLTRGPEAAFEEVGWISPRKSACVVEGNPADVHKAG